MVRRKPSPKHGAMQIPALHALKSIYFQAYRAYRSRLHRTL